MAIHPMNINLTQTEMTIIIDALELKEIMSSTITPDREDEIEALLELINKLRSIRPL